MNRKVLISLMVLIAMATASVNAQQDFRKRGPKSPNPEVVKYLQDNVFPVMKIQRSELDKELSAKEKTRIAEIRTEIKTMHEARIDKRAEMNRNIEKPTLEQRKEMREMRIKMTGLMDEIEIIADNHDATISRLFDEIGNDIEQWKTDLRNIRMDNCPQGLNCPNHPDGNAMQGQCRGMGPGAKHGRGLGPCAGKGNGQGREMKPGFGQGPGGQNPMQRLFTPEGFLLWNPENPMPFTNDENAPENGLQLNIFPNPAAQNVQISIMLKTDSKVTINIIDKQGNEIQQIKADKASQGLYTKTVDISKLKDGLYFIKVKAGEESALERLIIKN